MKLMKELLAPAGSFEALVAAISNGANAIYLGMQRFGARAYASNFTEENLKDVIIYAHLRGVKIYITINTIVFENELKDMYEMVDFLYNSGVDGLIIQDLAVFDYVTKTYPTLEAHCSTQMGIDDLEGTLLFKELGAKRVVLSREVPMDKIKEIKNKAKIQLEIFVHGALCVSYSGNCLMSGLIGYRSGNRGRCVGSCRKEYTLFNTTTNKVEQRGYLLSMKDLNTLDYIDKLEGIDSFKIEGRMKEPTYVANVVNTYRKAIDHLPYEKKHLEKTFNRTFTKGYIFLEDKKNITNPDKPNNYGFLIGKVIGIEKNRYKIKLFEQLRQNDIIKIVHNNEDINLSVNKLYNQNDQLITIADSLCYIKIKEKLSLEDKIYKTKDYLFYKELEKSYPKEFKRFPLKLKVFAYPESKLFIQAECDKKQIEYESKEILEAAKTKETTALDFQKQFNRLNETVYQLEEIDYEAQQVFIPAKMINEARKIIVEQMNLARLSFTPLPKNKTTHNKISYPISNPKLAVYAETLEQAEVAKECGIEFIYYKDNFIKRNEANYQTAAQMVLVGGYGGIYAFRGKKQIVTDYSLNVVNSKAVYLLHSLGVDRVTLSYEINKKEIKDLIENYIKENNGLPNLEMIVYGNAPLMQTKYCPLKPNNLCGKCKTNKYVLKDEYSTFPIISHEDCTTTILNGKTLNLIDELDNLSNIAIYRLQFSIEDRNKTKQVIQSFQNKLNKKDHVLHFNQETDTRGHFNKEIL